jgi:MFS family permease
MGLSVVTGRLADRFGPRPMVWAGAASLGTGLLLTSTVSHIAVGYLTYGVFLGIATSCCYVPTVAQVGGWFERKRTTALGVAVAGIGLGTLAGPIITDRLIDAYGWRTTYRVLAVASVVILLVASLLIRRAPSAGAAPLPALRAIFANPTFQRLYVSGVLMGLALFVPFVFLVPYAK